MKAYKCDVCGNFYTLDDIIEYKSVYSQQEIELALHKKYGNLMLSLDICKRCQDEIAHKDIHMDYSLDELLEKINKHEHMV